MIRLIVTDMDGTLLDSNHNINNEFWELFEKIKKKNIIFSSASGRQIHSLYNKLEPVKNDVLFIAENGTYVTYKGEELYLNAFDKATAYHLVSMGRKLDHANVVLCGKKSAYIESKDEKFISEVQKYYEVLEVVDDLLAVEDDFLKVTICDFTGVEENSYPHFSSEVNKYRVAISGEIWLDITKKNANKGVAIEYLQELWNIKPEETMAFGDYLNDIEMLMDAKYSYAMADAHPELKKVASEIIGTNNDNSVVNKIKEVLSLT